MSNYWIDNGFDMDCFNKTMLLHMDAMHLYGVPSRSGRKVIYDQLLMLAESLMKHKKPECDYLEPYHLVRACFTPYGPVKNWPHHWHQSKHGAWTENFFLEANEVVDRTPLDAFDPSVCSAFSWFAATMLGCMKELDALIPMEFDI